ncbi:Low affinity iron permease, Fet4 [Cordyceps fumosorosea ARSEF 2679]|uniref:Low affinity iron permease, Fet4 n=1 Tax=Cordyceps fumosorosea (strain ARSEF 2679) TaxID=1081104 RepID=A0A167UBB0_CORFA|nr:Low affinity iron permease, Fet4 [Cordyceps fumosorosea ARSEF 2679]OAA61410.1 Low affinity iron permease, Fet4 [Cordyceps fumosorosea ARSEF 2679]
MGKIYDWLAAPGKKGPIADTAPTQVVARFPSSDSRSDKLTAEVTEVCSKSGDSVHNVTGYVDKQKDGRLDRWLDWVVRASGSEPVFLFILAGLLVWALVGIKYGQTDSWAVMISDIQAILSYLFDSLLVRQQLNGYDKMIRLTASLRSRSASHRRMVRTVQARGQGLARGDAEAAAALEERFRQKLAEAGLPQEGWLGRASTKASAAMGHFVTICLYWVGIFVWLGFGHYCGWSDRWQLYINSATSALMVLIFAFLANIRERHALFTNRWLNLLFEADSTVEQRLRQMTGDEAPNEVVEVPAPKMSHLQRAIFYYADFVGTLTGVGILIAVIVVWVAIGPAMGFNNNWWLLIGTYAGLIGLNDGFVLRNLQHELERYEDAAFEEAGLDDVAVMEAAAIADPAEHVTRAKPSLSTRLSERMGAFLSHEYVVMADVVLIIGLIIGASAMRWTVTGQLLCNVPPSVIESFIMLILITGHNLGEVRRRESIENMYLRRLKVLTYVDMVGGKNGEKAW